MSETPASLPTSYPPFSCTFTREVPDILQALRCSLALTTYQAGKVVVLSPNGEDLKQLGRTFHSPMGLGVSGAGSTLRMALATRDQLVILENAPTLASRYPNNPDVYDALLLPRLTHHTGPLDLHDLAWGGDDNRSLWAVNTLFSCLCRVNGRYSFEPAWQPSFISELEPSDRCHLNGLTLENGAPRYVTALGTTDTPRGWSENRLTGGVLIDVPSGEIVVSGLAMPHSPRLFDGHLWVLLSATGELARVHPEEGTVDVVCNVGGFARGLAKRGDYLFIGVSKIRKRSTFAGLPISDQPIKAGIVIVHAPSGRVAGQIQFLTSVEEVYDVHVLPEVLRPGLVGLHQEVHRRAIVLESGGYWAHTEAPPADAAVVTSDSASMPTNSPSA